jgi:hypothetical protein
MDDTTLTYLDRMFVKIFEKAGWMRLTHHKISQDEDYVKKLDGYIASIKKLIKDINEHINNPRGNNTLTRDLPTMHENLEYLLNYFINITNVEPLDVTGTGESSIDDMSLQWMRHFYIHVFEKFGWMVLLKSNLDNGHYANKSTLEKYMRNKLDNYADSLDILLESIKHRADTSTDIDVENLKHDLLVMHNNIKILNGAVKNLLTTSLNKNKVKLDISLPSYNQPNFEMADMVEISENDEQHILNKLKGGGNDNLLLQLFN